MSRKRTRQPITPKKGWALYLRTSDQEAQNPENSQRRQRDAIQRSLIERSELSIVGEYIDNLSGRSASMRDGYQQMLEDARNGLFSFVAVENAERFGRNDTEALTAIDELDKLGIAVRFADYPDLDPIDPDDRILVSLSFTLARRESIKLGQRVRGGLHAKLRSGGFAGRAPDGYRNVERKTATTDKTQYGRYTRWVEKDPERCQIYRFAWDLLLEDQYTLEEICEKLHAKGYKYRTGRPFIEIKKSGKRKANKNTISRAFHNWFYAGWVVSEKAEIPPKTVRGQWEPIVSTEEFERGLSILAKRDKHRIYRRKHDYLLKGLVHIQLDTDDTQRLTCSTSNSSRPGGGTRYYCIPRSNVNILCSIVDEQMSEQIRFVSVDKRLIPLIRESYTTELAEKLGHLRPDERKTIEDAIKSVDDEEARVARLFATGKITEDIWDSLWREWQDRRQILREKLEGLARKREYHIGNLDAALHIIEKLSILYDKLESSDQKRLLRQMVERIIVDPSGKIIRMELQAPFAYLERVKARIEDGSDGADSGEKTKTSLLAGQCSDRVPLGVPAGIRTPDPLFRRQVL